MELLLSDSIFHPLNRSNPSACYVSVKTCPAPDQFPLQNGLTVSPVPPNFQDPPYNCRDRIRYQCPPNCRLEGNRERECVQPTSCHNPPFWSGSTPRCICGKITHYNLNEVRVNIWKNTYIKQLPRIINILLIIIYWNLLMWPFFLPGFNWYHKLTQSLEIMNCHSHQIHTFLFQAVLTLQDTAIQYGHHSQDPTLLAA